MKKPKFRFLKRIKPPPLPIVLSALSVIAILAELFALYKYGYLSVTKKSDTTGTSSAQVLNFKAFEKVRDSMDQSQLYQVPGYQLQSLTGGKDDPLAEF
ncbi:MAG: hypothetical protein A3C85_03315 [Candidatus Doudnabacteria bacterium RIFCSPHIGHO2_02_FULL_48_21]|uniref:Uncharacterized protein n=1 Tax=Candidatus Doudnabacteria bacterium RIFCSPLOWO2_02_FULL_48_13 TaxID=1817845 RepID=A0A1F5QAY0_9BACT|nr:MAG: hypothetical protein A3K05_03805 [Candidatus Doudnabacteria bacterium RIFCSPHIGHO2_01_48_18]OGE77217.1 MAG: hypothetical protein A2668_01815 [Candidatus Doudnabacteria bacterium RIFCSPHIGHO2_01_FULL_48_180]OGE91427.1 MAG: hypothetical protein A3F44_00715 [Candidatus Doudnabacteria bacterium RIFCSPHIGHO2_12_FULL_47_25]OGE93275.1 MAG: hypothetical protein A3C85_03315 [Candidatus Doudnabacteria bacterium RIFCSPHIGHO2_02_FULL_48_21]OGE96806.1 MAG: hypothetical protein A3A83_02050 [Candidatu